MWDTSTLSFDSQMLRECAIEEAVAARRAAEAEIDTLRNDLMRQSKECDNASRAFEDELMEMESRLDKALTDRNEIETIAEEAIAAQDLVERDVSMLQESLETQKGETESAMAKYSQEVESRIELSKQLEWAMSSLQELQSSHSPCSEVIADLEATVDRLVTEAEGLMEARDAIEAKSTNLSHMIEVQDSEFEHSKEEIFRLWKENEMLTLELQHCHTQFQEAQVNHTMRNEQLQAERVALESELETWQRRCREVEASRERAAHGYMEERSSLLDELSDATKRLKDTEQAFAKLRNDAKDKLKELVNQNKAASATIEKLKDENVVHAESNNLLCDHIKRAERGRESLQRRMIGLQERLEVEQLARQKAEDCILQLESGTTTTIEPEIQTDQVKACQQLNSQLNHYLCTEEEMEAEKSSMDRPDGSAGFENDLLRDALGEESKAGKSKQWQAEFVMLRNHLGAEYHLGNPGSPGAVAIETYRAEQARRMQVEDLAARISVNAKEGLEKRNKEILNLKLHFALVADEKESEILRLRKQLHAMRRESFS